MKSSTKGSKSLDNPVWFITGCSTGFGHQIARHVLELGYRVVITARDTEDIRGLAQYGDALVLELDVTNRSQAEAAVKTAEDHFGGIDVLVNNAGIGYFAAVEESDEAEVRKMFEVNVFGLCRMIHIVLPGMRKRRKGFTVIPIIRAAVAIAAVVTISVTEVTDTYTCSVATNLHLHAAKLRVANATRQNDGNKQCRRNQEFSKHNQILING